MTYPGCSNNALLEGLAARIATGLLGRTGTLTVLALAFTTFPLQGFLFIRHYILEGLESYVLKNEEYKLKALK